MQCDLKEENFTISIDEDKPDQTAPFTKKELKLKRKEFKEDSINIINSALNYFVKIVEETITFEKINCLNLLLYNALIYLETNSSLLVSGNNENISTIDAEQITNEQLLAINELNLWKKINDFLDKQQVIINIMDNIYFLREIKDYINNVLYKN